MANNNTLRIISGKLRGRKIYFDDSEGLRPTPERVRETLFNWLQDMVAESTCLDLFAGSGALGIEALSRGAKKVFFVDNNEKVTDLLGDNIEDLQLEHEAQIFVSTAEIFLENTQDKFDIIFLDPPFHKDLLANILNIIKNKNLARYIYLEHEKQLNLDIPAEFEILKDKKAGKVCYKLLSL